MSNQKTNTKGFTIIEVVLVLAIAGLIFLVVFLALPALQRGQRDNQRRSDLSRMMSQVTNYQSNHQGSLPTTGNWNGSFKEDYLTNDNQTFDDPTTGETYTIDPTTNNPSGVSEGEIWVYVGYRCGGDDGVQQLTGTNNRAFAAVVYQEQGGYYCQNN